MAGLITYQCECSCDPCCGESVVAESHCSSCRHFYRDQLAIVDCGTVSGWSLAGYYHDPLAMMWMAGQSQLTVWFDDDGAAAACLLDTPEVSVSAGRIPSLEWLFGMMRFYGRVIVVDMEPAL